METPKTQPDFSILKKFLDASFPLMETFRRIAPGTFAHCDNVADLCEAVGLELGLNTDVMAVIGKYHDLGKMNFPEAFSENQNGTNMHDNLEPSISYQIITRHVGDTAIILLNERDFPRELIEMILQHHGDTILRPFYNKAGSAAVEDMFRYKCKRPQTIESAVLMICDGVEATARSIATSKKAEVRKKIETQEGRKEIVLGTINRLMDDDQLDDITVGQIKKVRRVLIKELDNRYHTRVEYPDDEKNDKDGLRINDNGD